MSYLVSTYGYTLGSLVEAKVKAHNTNGYGEYSPVNVAGSTIQTAPTTMNAPISGSATSSTQIQVTWSALTASSDTGGSAITSYNLEWD